jgi:hypothetical protein
MEEIRAEGDDSQQDQPHSTGIAVLVIYRSFGRRTKC